MKRPIVAAILAIGVNVILGHFTSAIAANTTQTIEASFYLVKESEAKPIADREVIVVPCAPVNGNCQDVINAIEKLLSGMASVNSEKGELLDINIKTELKKLVSVQTVRTGIDGTIVTECQTTDCIVYSSAISNSSNTFWLKLQQQGTKAQYLPSSGIEIATASLSPQMQELAKSLNNLQAQLSVGTSFSSFSDKRTSFIAAFSAVSESADVKNYEDTLIACDKIALQLELLSKAWQAYINGTQTLGGETVHLAHKDFVEPLIESFNSVSGSEVIVLQKPKNGFLSSLFGARNVYKMDGILSLMMTAIDKKIDYALATYEAKSDGMGVPVVDFGSNSSPETEPEPISEPKRQSLDVYF